MKKLSTALALALALVFSIPAAAQPTGLNHNLKAVTTTETGAWINTDGNCATAVAWSASTSSATVVLEQSNDGTTAFIPGNGTTDGTFTNPAVAATSLGCFMAKFSRLRVSAYSSGTLSGDLSWFKASPIPANVTTVNNVTITKPVSRATLTIASGKTATISKTLTLTGTDSTTMTFPTTSATIARTDAANTFTGVQTMTSPVLTTPAIGAATGASLVLTANATANHLLTGGTAPTVTGGSSTCGTTAAAIAGKDGGGKVTVGSVGGTACVVTFGTAYGNAPACSVVSATAVDVHAASTTTTLTVAGTFGAGEVFMYNCIGY
jgi:hypothetical protein